jgi:hypothetical protein
MFKMKTPTFSFITFSGQENVIKRPENVINELCFPARAGTDDRSSLGLLSRDSAAT